MIKLQLKHIRKTYKSGETVIALKDLSIGFRAQEFVSILGPSGCGKTTLLNLIGGLDQYDQGDLIINGISTKLFKQSDWDAYRNRSIGFVFQSYNLIGHQSVLQNVEIAMTLSGVTKSERKKRATKALQDVGLGDQIHKKPNQLSGGQMQRVAIARALVNNPDIILADEPTGALDSHTSVQIMDILKEIAKEKLVIMVTHNAELAAEYSDRVVKLLDGALQDDSKPITSDEAPIEIISENKKSVFKKTSMSLSTALSLSLKNLLTKRGRTIITSFAGSIGIIGVALVLALSSGLSSYIDSMQSDTLSGFPITITSGMQRVDFTERPGFNNVSSDQTKYTEYPNTNEIYVYDQEKNTTLHENSITNDYVTYVEGLKTELPEAVNAINYTYAISSNVLAKADEAVVKFETSGKTSTMATLNGNTGFWQELPESEDFVLSLYDLLGDGSRLPQNENEVVLVVDAYNRIDSRFFSQLGLNPDETAFSFESLVGQTILKVIPNDLYYTETDGLFTGATPLDYEKLYDDESSIPLTIVGILRPKDDTGFLSTGIAYTHDLTNLLLMDSQNSKIAKTQESADYNVLLGTEFNDQQTKALMLLALGADTTPYGINIYPTDYDSKELIKDYLEDYNINLPTEDQILYSDLAETITDMTGTLLDTITYVLVGFAAISLVVSTIMISIITYVSVIERTKEIGILRAVGARKKDISRVFNAETIIIGFTAGVIGVGLSFLLTLPINQIISKLVDIDTIATLLPQHAIILIIGSMILTLIAGLIPAKMAANKDPVVALRTE